MKIKLSFDEFSRERLEQELKALAEKHVPNLKSEHLLRLHLLAEATAITIDGAYPSLRLLSTKTECPVYLRMDIGKRYTAYVQIFFHSRSMSVEIEDWNYPYVSSVRYAIPFMQLFGVDLWHIYEHNAKWILRNPERVEKLKLLNPGRPDLYNVVAYKDGVVAIKKEKVLFFKLDEIARASLEEDFENGKIRFLELNKARETLWKKDPFSGKRYYCDDYVLISDKMLSPHQVPESLKKEIILRKI